MLVCVDPCCVTEYENFFVLSDQFIRPGEMLELMSCKKMVKPWPIMPAKPSVKIIFKLRGSVGSY